MSYFFVYSVMMLPIYLAYIFILYDDRRPKETINPIPVILYGLLAGVLAWGVLIIIGLIRIVIILSRTELFKPYKRKDY